MASNKKRKLNGLTEPNRISAIAARKLLQDGPKSPTQRPGPASSQADGFFNNSLIPLRKPATPTFQKGIDLGFCDFGEGAVTNDGNMSDTLSYVKDEDSKSASRAQDSAGLSNPLVHLTTLSPNKNSIKRLKSGGILVKLAPGERLVVLGEYGILVVKGQITILGAILSASDTVYSVFALSSHSLPVIRFFASENDRAEIQLHEHSSTLRSLHHLSPLFVRLWAGSGKLHDLDQRFQDSRQRHWKSENSSFEILFSNNEASRKIYYHPIVCPPEWNETLSATASRNRNQGSPSITMICGPKSSGKSTFAKLLTNRLLTSGMPILEQATTVPVGRKNHGVVILDIDPGQPEYTPPGQLSLVYLTEPNFGPPYSHPGPSNARRECIRAHSIASNSPATDTTLYMACVADLILRYRALPSGKKCPLVINTPGWVLGTGLELLVKLILEASPTEIIYMSQEGPSDVVQSLKDAAGSIPFIMLPSQLTEFTTRTATHLRLMQAMSYLHLRPGRRETETWDPNPLVFMPPLVVKYAGNDAGIFGVLCQGEQPPAEMLIETIGGTLVAVVVIDDMAAIPSLTSNAMDPNSDGFADELRYDGKIDCIEKTHSELTRRNNLEEPIVIQTPELVPYFNPKNTISLDPRYCHSIGLALVRGVDIKRHRFHLLTPISSSFLKNIRSLGKSIVLVSGKLDTPGWAYTEQLYKRDRIGRMGKNQNARLPHGDAEGRGGAKDDAELDGENALRVDFEHAPWIEMVQGDQGRGAGAKVWRVRRDLGKDISE